MKLATDRRVKYTRMVLRESLIELLQEKPISRLTIKELCQRADINRATFYSHYHDQYDLLKTIETSFIADINSHLDRFALEADEASMVEILTAIFEHLAENRELCQVLLGNNTDLDFQANIMKAAGQRVLLEWRKNKGVNEAAEYMYTYVATGAIGVIRRWIQEEKPQTPRQVAEFVTRLVYKGIEAFFA